MLLVLFVRFWVVFVGLGLFCWLFGIADFSFRLRFVLWFGSRWVVGYLFILGFCWVNFDWFGYSLSVVGDTFWLFGLVLLGWCVFIWSLYLLLACLCCLLFVVELVCALYLFLLLCCLCCGFDACLVVPFICGLCLVLVSAGLFWFYLVMFVDCLRDLTLMSCRF